MKIVPVANAIGSYNTVTHNETTSHIKELASRQVGHDEEVFILTDDGREIFCGYFNPEGVEHDGKFYINDGLIVLSNT